MMMTRMQLQRNLFFVCVFFISSTCYALNNFSSYLSSGHIIAQLGGFWGIQGQEQHVYIQDLIGDQFTLNNSNDSNIAVGLGYFIDLPNQYAGKLSVGVNGFYLANTTVKGNVVQENLFNNLSYQYSLNHIPLYFLAKYTLPTKWPLHFLVVDGGIGANFMTAQSFREYPLNSASLPDVIYGNHTSTVFSASFGIGLKKDQAFKNSSFECGYRFFYLGDGRLKTINSQVLNALDTGHIYSNAILCSIMI